ncbi:TonB-dependent receptor [Myxococcota bacterium]|nr:TonB-dependent receptor [Myxococcota bacterium]
MGSLGPGLVAIVALVVAQAGPAPTGQPDVPDEPPRLADPSRPRPHWEPTALAADTATSTAGLDTQTSTRTDATREAHAATSSTARARTEPSDAPDLVGEDPLSDEDLALLAALDARTATTSTGGASLSATWWLIPEPLPRSTILVPRARLREAVGRTLGETLDVLPTITDTSRRWIPHDALVVRGQSGHRVAMTIDGVPLRHALSPSSDTTGASLIDPWMIDTVMVERPRSIGASPHGSAATISLVSPEPRARGLGGEVELEARTADRSTSAHAAAEAGASLGALRVAAGYGDFRATRISGTTGGTEVGDPYQRLAASARGRLLGRPGDQVRISAGVDLDRLLNVARTDLGFPRTREEENERVLTFARAELGDAKLGGSALVSRQSFSVSRSLDGGGAIDDDATSYFGRAVGHLELFPGMIARAGASFETSAGERAGQWSGDVQSTELFVGAEVDVEDAAAYGTVAIVGTGAEVSGPSLATREASSVAVLTQGGLRVRVAGPFAVRGGYSEARYVPSVVDLALVDVPLETERSRTVELGPSVFTRAGFFELLGFFTRIEDAIEPITFSSEQVRNIAKIDLFGVELVGGLVLRERIRLAAALTWTEARDLETDAPLVTLPTITGRGSVRYDFRTRGAFVEAHVRGTTEPLHVTSLSLSTPTAALAALAPSTFARVGLTGATDLGSGLRLALSIENVLDTSHRAPMSLVPGAGIDVRAALSWTLD